MNNPSISGLYVDRVNRQLPKVLDDLRLLIKHLRFLSELSETKSMDPREMLRCVNTAKQSALELKHEVSHLAELQASVRRRHLGDRYGSFASNAHGMLRHISRAFVDLENAWTSLESKAKDQINEPGRWGDAAAPGAVTDLFSLIGQILEFWSLLRVKKKLNA